jgi:hypothetical protein
MKRGLLAVGLRYWPSLLLGQTGPGTVNGQVRDSSGAFMAKVEIRATNTETNITRRTETNSEGIYSIPGLLPGVYKLTARCQGFKTLDRGYGGG